MTKNIPMEDFFRNPERSSYRISPDGKFFSYLAPYERRMNIFIQRIGDDSDAIMVTSEKERGVLGYFWANNSRILFLKDTGGDENYHLYGVNIDGSGMTPLTAFQGVRTEIIDDLEDFPDEVIIGLNKRNPQIFDPYRLNVVTGELTMLAENPGTVQVWETDHDGKLRLAMALDGVNSTLLYRADEDMPFEPIITCNFKEALSPFSFTFDNRYLYAGSNINRDKSALVIIDPTDGKEIELLYENDKYDITGISLSTKNKKLLQATYIAHCGAERFIFDDQWRDTREKIEKKLPNYRVGITDQSRDELMMIVVSYTDKSPGSYWLYDVANDNLTKIADITPWINEEDMGTMFPITYQSRDGLHIEGYLTLPKGTDLHSAKMLPVIVNPHGGPWARDSWGYNPEAQFLVNRGFALFQMNFRGSTGYGREFWEKSFKEWGKAMQDDITDGVNHLIQLGIADPDRIGIYGGSYGGYAALAGLTFTPDLYACGVDYVGVSNLFTFMNTIPPYWKPFLDMMYEMVGNPNDETERKFLTESSPVFHVDKIKAPLFIAQGANDPRVNKDESDQMVKALRSRGVDVQYMLKMNEGHGFQNEENRFDFYREMELFFEKYLF